MKLITILFISLFLITQAGMGQTADSSIIITNAHTKSEPSLDTNISNNPILLSHFTPRTRLWRFHDRLK